LGAILEPSTKLAGFAVECTNFYFPPAKKSGGKSVAITIVDVGYALWFIFPAYCANAVPVIFGGGYPLDACRTFFDGKPILGSHKTLRGFLSGLIAGTLVGYLQTLLFQNVIFQYDSRFQYDIMLGFVLSLGALFGDLVESFIKRRLSIPPGSSLLVADQLDFVVGALFFSLPFSSLPLFIMLLIILITLPLHLLTNILAEHLSLRRESKGN
jgi:CDP-2,3-bis-(O-geranylgeranyl)-sn-glycerol synthase